MLAFGLPGTGKTHALCDLDLDLPVTRARQLRFLLLDDLNYLPQGAHESEVLFALIAERYEHRSLGITSNLVFSE